MLLRYLILPARKKLPYPPTLAAQTRCSYFRAGRVSQVGPIDFESQMVVGVHHLMGQGVFQVALRPHLVGADLDAVVWGEAPSLSDWTAPAADVGGVEVAVEFGDAFSHEANYGACFFFTSGENISKGGNADWLIGVNRLYLKR